MKLISLYIERHMILRDLTIRFDRPGRLNMGEYALDFLVGLNGSGKSTLLRVLAQIVTDLHANRPTGFNYRLEYELQRAGRLFRVQLVRKQPELTMTVRNVDEGTVPLENDMVDSAFLPERVIAYTTGALDQWVALEDRLLYSSETLDAADDILGDPIERTIAELPGNLPRVDDEQETDDVQSPLLLLRESRLAIITLTGLLASLRDESHPLQDVLESLNVADLRGFSLRLRLHEKLSDHDVFNALRSHAARHVQQGGDHLLVFELPSGLTPRREFIQALWAEYASPLAFYEALDQLCEPLITGEPTLQQTNIFLEREFTTEEEDSAPRVQLFEWLSDGEQSFLSRMAMLAMLQTDNSLILLDEPEVHFNDYWKREIVRLIDTVMHDHTNHLLIVSHSSIGLSDVPDAQVTVMSQTEEGLSTADGPAVKTFGTDPSEIMVVVFHTRLATGAYAADLLKSVVESGERHQLQNFLEVVGPGMWHFRLLQRLEASDAPPT